MNKFNIFKISIVLGTMMASFLFQENLAYSAGCFDKLSNAETQWNELRSKAELPPGFERKVSRHLRSAAELRHEGDVKGCLRQIELAKEEMNNHKHRN